MSLSLPERLDDAYLEIGKHCGYWSCIDEAADHIRALEAENKRLKEVLGKYGAHTSNCASMRGHFKGHPEYECNCGWVAAAEAALPKSSQES